MNKKFKVIFLSIIFIYTFANTHAWLFPKTEASCDYDNPVCNACYEDCKNNPIVSRTTCNVHMIHCCRDGVFPDCFPGQMGMGMMPGQMGMGMMPGQMGMGMMPYGQMPMMQQGQFPNSSMPY